jgi:hypothetical protein
VREDEIQAPLSFKPRIPAASSANSYKEHLRRFTFIGDARRHDLSSSPGDCGCRVATGR